MKFIQTLNGNLLNLKYVYFIEIFYLDGIYYVTAKTNKNEYDLFESNDEGEAENFLGNLYIDIR